MENPYQEDYALPEDWLLEIAALRQRLNEEYGRNAVRLDQLSNAVTETLRRRYQSARRVTEGKERAERPVEGRAA